MNRSGYDDRCDGWELIRWRGAVNSAIRGKRGQAFLREMLDALDAMPVKRLIAHELEDHGDVCAMGAVGQQRGINMQSINAEERDDVAAAFGIAPALAAEIAFINDDDGYSGKTTPEQRWASVRAWVEGKIK